MWREPGPPGVRARSPRLKSPVGLDNSASTEVFLGSGRRRLDGSILVRRLDDGRRRAEIATVGPSTIGAGRGGAGRGGKSLAAARGAVGASLWRSRLTPSPSWFSFLGGGSGHVEQHATQAGSRAPAARADHLRRRDQRRHAEGRAAVRRRRAGRPVGQPKEALKPLKERKVVNIDRDNFNDVLAKAAPRRGDEGPEQADRRGHASSAVELNFKSIDDFEPAKVAEQVGPLKELLEMRQRLTQLLSKMEGNDKLETLLADVLAEHREGQGAGQADGHRRGFRDHAARDGGTQMSTRRTGPGGRRGRATTQEAPNLLDQVIAATRPQTDAGGRPGQGLLPAVPRPGRQAGPGRLQGRRDEHQDLDRRDRQEALRPAQRDHARPGLPEAGRRPGAGCTTWSTRRETGENLKIRVLNVTKQELFKDLEKAVEFDQSSLFKKIYEEEYGQLGGQPYGMLVGDYEFGRTPEDISLLEDDLRRGRRGARAVRRRRRARRCSASTASPSWPTRATWPRSSTASSTPPGSRSASRKTRGTSP